jgi:hypothetical protein
MSQLKIYRSISVLLLILNLAMLIFFFRTKGPHSRHRGPQMNHIHEILDLDSEQSDRFKSLVTEHKEAMLSISKNQRNLINQYFSPLKSPDSKKENSQILIDYNSAEERKLETTYAHFQAIKALLNADQVINFNKFMEVAMHEILGDQEIKAHPPKDYKH